ncbi:VOC family protein [Sneathiella litorea]|uniref:VOC family protein n=1 Tax=Sneathiella litorea TaxID=2606216 RepID=A0A6L8W9E2_9PROT|nr:VOC family protein [Sneathiella litorea]MZR31134.1 VOC family protein [Sneathiella litorea]
MIGYITLGTNDIDKATEFYEALLSEIGAKRVVNEDHLKMWSVARGQPMLGVIKPHNGEAATFGNGTMPALLLDSTETVTKMHAKAIELGGTDEGAPGPRGGGQLFFGYFRDPEGHKIAFYAPNKAKD